MQHETDNEGFFCESAAKEFRKKLNAEGGEEDAEGGES